MLKRIIDVSEHCYLHLKNSQLIISRNKATIATLAIEDIGVLILQHSAIVISQQLVIACQKHKVAVVFCDNRHLPFSVILPIAEGNRLHNKILRQQLAISEATRKRLWQNIVRQKINQQAKALQITASNHQYLVRLAKQIKTNDSTNCEAIAAQYYWPRLFKKPFVRDVNAEGINALLNYGYSIIRAMIARSICAAGLHPGIGLFHSNQYNPLCLADDLMEPFRPWVDLLVYGMHKNNIPLEISQQTKEALLGLLARPVIYNQKKMPLMVSTHYLLADLKRCYLKEKRHLKYPELVSYVW